MIEASALPISRGCEAQADPLAAALNEGEDFELLFTLSPEQWEKIASLVARSGADLPEVGRITDTGRMEIRMPDGQVD